MARAPAGEDNKGAAHPKKPSMIAVVIEMAFLTCFAVGAGGLFGMMVLGGAGKAGAKPEPAIAPAHKPKQADTMNVKPLPAVVTNLAGPRKAWIRLEAALVVGELPEFNAVSAAIVDDFVAYLRTVPLSQIEGPSGFLHLREDLNERARIRSGGKVKELVVQSLMLE
jgi:flagellar protein FliL